MFMVKHISCKKEMLQREGSLDSASSHTGAHRSVRIRHGWYRVGAVHAKSEQLLVVRYRNRATWFHHTDREEGCCKSRVPRVSSFALVRVRNALWGNDNVDNCIAKIADFIITVLDRIYSHAPVEFISAHFLIYEKAFAVEVRIPQFSWYNNVLRIICSKI